MQSARMHTGKTIDQWCLDKAQEDLKGYNQNRYRLDYVTRIGQLEHIFGKDNLKLYSYEAWKSDNIYDNFLRAIGIENFSYREPKKLNQGLSHMDLELLRLFTVRNCLLYTSPSPRDQRGSRMPSSA